MYKTPRQYIDALGGYREVAARFGIASTTMHSHLTSGHLPPKLYKACCELSAEKGLPPPHSSLFSFSDLTPSTLVSVDIRQDDAA